MNRTHTMRLVVGLSCIVAAGCGGAQVRVEHDELHGHPPAVYAWKPSATSPQVREAIEAPWLDELLHDAINAELAEKGYTRASDAGHGEIAVGYFVLVNTRADAITLDSYRAYQDERAVRGGYLWWPYPPDMPVSRTTIYEQAELVFTVSAPEDDSILWQASAVIELDTIDNGKLTAKRIAERKVSEKDFRQAVHALLQRLPYPRNSPQRR